MMLGELDGEGRDAARPTLDEDRLAGLSCSEFSTAQIAVRPVSAIAAASTCDRLGRLLADDIGADRQLLAVGAVAAGLEHAEHLVADLEIARRRRRRR